MITSLVLSVTALAGGTARVQQPTQDTSKRIVWSAQMDDWARMEAACTPEADHGHVPRSLCDWATDGRDSDLRVALDTWNEPPSKGNLNTHNANGTSLPAGSIEAVVLTALTDLVIERTRTALVGAQVGALYHYLCDAALIGVSLPSTCPLLDAARSVRRLPPLNVLRLALRADVLRAPESAIEGSLAASKKRAKTEAQRADLLHAWIALRLLRTTVEGGSLSSALDTMEASVPSSVQVEFASHPSEAFALATLIKLGRERWPTSGGTWDKHARAAMAAVMCDLQAGSGIGHSLLPRWNGDSVQAAAGSLAKTTAQATNIGQSISHVLVAAKTVDSATRASAPAAELVSEKIQWLQSSLSVVSLVIPLADSAGTPWRDLMPPLMDAYAAVLHDDYGNALLTGLRSAKALAGPDSLKTWFVVATLADGILQDSAGATTQVLQSLVTNRSAPEIKRTAAGTFYLTLQSYLGLAYGREAPIGTSPANGVHYGAPVLAVGLEGGFRVCHRVSFGVLIQVLDLGALASYRIQASTDTAAAPNVGFAQVWSPGIAVTLGPLTSAPLTVGYQIIGTSPALREVTSGRTTTSIPVNRRGWFIAYALPLGVLLKGG